MGARATERGVIRIRRPAKEPSELTKARREALNRLRPDGPETRDDLPRTYKTAHDALWKAQYYKCAYCELREQDKRNDVEHFRPAMRAVRTPGSDETHGYWWLAYTWENLLFSCRNCNQSPAKLDKFPLDVGSVALQPEQAPPGRETPLLLDPADPAAESAIDHIEFVPEERAGRQRWVPRPRNGSRLGLHTIRVCMLDRPGLITLYTSHVELTLKQDIAKLEGALETCDAPTIQKQWGDFTGRHVVASAVFAALSRDVAAHTVDIETRAEYELTLPTL